MEYQFFRCLPHGRLFKKGANFTECTQPRSHSHVTRAVRRLRSRLECRRKRKHTHPHANRQLSTHMTSYQGFYARRRVSTRHLKQKSYMRPHTKYMCVCACVGVTVISLRRLSITCRFAHFLYVSAVFCAAPSHSADSFNLAKIRKSVFSSL